MGNGMIEGNEIKGMLMWMRVVHGCCKRKEIGCVDVVEERSKYSGKWEGTGKGVQGEE